MPDSGLETDLPIYILGMPRSGTSLVEQILDSHPMIHGAGELSEIGYINTELEGKLSRAGDSEERNQIMQSSLSHAAKNVLEQLKAKNPNAKHVSDKMPQNFLHVGLISKLFPNAKVVFCRKNAFDNCLGIYFKSFKGSHPYSYDLRDIAMYYRDHLRLMQHWMDAAPIPILEIRNEDLVADQEAQTRRLIEFIGVPWNDACLRFHENKRVTITASNEQVRRPIYKTKTPRWKRYEKYIDPIREILGDPESDPQVST